MSELQSNEIGMTVGYEPGTIFEFTALAFSLP